MKITFTSEVVDSTRKNWQWNTVAVVEHYSNVVTIAIGNIPVRNEVQKVQALYTRLTGCEAGKLRLTMGDKLYSQLCKYIVKHYRVLPYTPYTVPAVDGVTITPPVPYFDRGANLPARAVDSL